METEEYDPELMKKAKALAAGPLGKEMAKFPLMFAKAAFFGAKPSKDKPIMVNNGTITLIDFKGRTVGITCFHVIDAFRKMIEDIDGVFQIGNFELEPLERIIDQSPEMDLVTIDLTDFDIKEFVINDVIESEAFAPHSWPPDKIENGEYVAFGGYPGTWRQWLSWNEIMFDSWSSGGSQITSVRENYFVCQFEREYWVESYNINDHDGLGLNNLGGLSGGPVFIHRQYFWELIGIIYEFSKEFDLMYIRPTSLIREDGTIINNS